jgi:SAM-dependent methyltransferase
MNKRSIERVLDGYAAAAQSDFVERSEAVSSDAMLGPFVDLLPPLPARILDVGAGTGRDAVWLTKRGYHVTAVEPVAALRDVAMRLHSADPIDWRDGAMPELAISPIPTEGFDMVLLSAVWQHLDDTDRALAMARIADLTAIGGLVLISLRQGPGAPTREVFDISVKATVTLAAENGLQVERQARIDSQQAGNRAAGVYWTWLALRRFAR